MQFINEPRINMPLAYRKEFRDAGYRLEDTMIALVWIRELPDGSAVYIHSLLRDGLSDSRPREDHEPCGYYRFHDCEMTDMGQADDPLSAIEAAAEIVPPVSQ